SCWPAGSLSRNGCSSSLHRLSPCSTAIRPLIPPRFAALWRKRSADSTGRALLLTTPTPTLPARGSAAPNLPNSRRRHRFISQFLNFSIPKFSRCDRFHKNITLIFQPLAFHVHRLTTP